MNAPTPRTGITDRQIEGARSADRRHFGVMRYRVIECAFGAISCQ